jgi:penicillin-binding protein 2
MRFGAIAIVMVSLFAALFARLWFLQVMTAPEYQVAADNNRIRVVQVEAPRGQIKDRNGTVLVGNRRSIVVTVDWQRYDRMERPLQLTLLARLARVLTDDAARRATGEVPSGDPGPQPTEGQSSSSSSTEPASSSTTTTTTTAPAGAVVTTSVTPKPVTVDQLEKRLADPRFSHFKPVPVATDVSEDLEIYLTEHASEYPTVAVDRITSRSYPYGTLLAHVLGYVGAINADELKAYQNKEKPYEEDDEIGKSGIERSMERELRGTPGEVRYEVDARNVPVRRLPGGRPPIPGNDVYLSIDINLQYLAEKSLAAELQVVKQHPDWRCDRTGCHDGGNSGSVVVESPKDGTILAMASYPTYDPAAFIGGISTQDYALLTSTGNYQPLTDKAISGMYAPGSTFKPFSAYAGLSNGQINPGSVVDDTGHYKIPDCQVSSGEDCERQGFHGQPHGTVNLSEALTVSSDIYFFKLGDDMWRNRGQLGDDALAKADKLWGFGADSGLDLGGESDGRVPDPEWRRAFVRQLYKGDEQKIEAYQNWRSGDNMNTAIGQGDVLVTPLQLANGYATFANGGTLYAPQLVLQVAKYDSSTVLWVTKPKPVRTIPMQPDWRDAILQGLEGVTTSGTAASTFNGFPQDRFQVAGKTGTAEVKGKASTSLFAAFAPASAPTVVAAAILPEAGEGGKAAAPLIRRILEPLANAGGDLVAFGQANPAPPGGGFDVNAAVNEVSAPSTVTGD